MPRFLQRALLLVIVLLLGACTVMRTDSSLEYRPTTSPDRQPIAALDGVVVRGTAVSDVRADIFTRRPLEDKRVLLNKRNGDGHKMPGTWALDKPLADYVTQAFDAGLKQAGAARDAASPRELRVRLDLLDEDVERGWWKSRTTLVLLAWVSVFDTVQDKELWRQRLVGRAQVQHQGLLYVGVEDYVVTLPHTLDNLVDQALASPGLRAALGAAPALPSPAFPTARK